MSYEMKALSCDPEKLPGLSEKLIVSHYENNYGRAVKRLNAIKRNSLCWILPLHLYSLSTVSSAKS